MMNSGESLFECAPRDPYTLAVRRVAERIAGNAAERHDDKPSVAVRLRSWIGAARG